VLGLYEALTEPLLRPYRLGLLLEAAAGNCCAVRNPAWLLMIRNANLDYLLVVPVALAVSFMVWVLWNLTKQIRR
jgi:hypothetical protein